MPVYDFVCRDCGKEFSETMSVREYERTKNALPCPACQSKEVKQLVTPFLTQTSKKS